ncbi:MAG: hypothetical protein WBS54_13600 [Acidobacteriota bacterium]
MSGVRKLRSFAPEESKPAANLWEVLERGREDTFPIHTALWLFKNARGGKGAFGHLPGPMFGYRTREREARHKPGDNPGLALQALAWFLCQPAYGKGYLAAGPTAGVYGGLSEEFLEPPVRLPMRPQDLPDEVQSFLQEASFPLSELPTLTRPRLVYYLILRLITYSTIFGTLETQLIHRAEALVSGKAIPDYVERDVQRAMDRAVQAFEMPSRTSWEYDRTRQEGFIRSVRCRKRTPPAAHAVGEDAASWSTGQPEATSPYSPPYLRLPIFDLRPFFQEASRLIKAVPEEIGRCPSLPFMTSEDWTLCHGFVTARKFSKKRLRGSALTYPKNAEAMAAWDWIESLYGRRVRLALYPSDKHPKE